MTTTEIKSLQPGQLYRVRMRKSSFDARTKSTLHTYGPRATRQFLCHELRFGNIPCAVFSGRITQRCSGDCSEVSIPYYDLNEAEIA